MARFDVVGSATNTAAQTVIEVANSGTNHRLFLEAITFGATGTPDDEASEYQVRQTTGLNGPVSTAVTPRPVDALEAAADAEAWEDPNAEPTYASGALAEFGLQLRSPFRWVALSVKRRPQVAASTGAGWGVICNAVTTAWAAHVTIRYEE